MHGLNTSAACIKSAAGFWNGATENARSVKCRTNHENDGAKSLTFNYKLLISETGFNLTGY